MTETLFEKKLEFPTARLEIKVTSTPSGQADLGAGQVMTFAEAKSLKSNGTKIRIPNPSGQSTSVVAAKFGNEIRLLDFVIPGEREQPELSFESTARSLVFMNPIFSSLSFEQRVSVFKAVSKNSQFQELVKLVSESLSILDEKAIDLSSDIALSVAKSLFAKSPSVTAPSKPSPVVTPVKPNNSANPFDQVQFPKPVCGDSLPADPKAYPVNLYPVFVDYSESNLQTVTSKFCQDALLKTIEKTGKQAVQVGSFLTVDRANAFKEFMLKNIGSGEVGEEPTVIEFQPTSKLNSDFKNLVAADNSKLGLFDWFVPPANAQSGTSKIKYEIAQQLDRNSVLLGQDTPLVLHGLELESTSDGIKISGTTPVAQQVLVLPAGKFPPFKQVTSEDYKNGGIRESDIVAEEIFLSTDINLPFIDNQLPSEPFSEILKPKTGSWKPGTYDVIMSPGIKYNRNGKYEFGAYGWNRGVAVINAFAAFDTWLDLNQLKVGGNKIGGNATETPKEKMIRIATKLNKANLLRDDCDRDLIKQKEGDNSFITLMNCFGKRANIFQIAAIVYDVDGDKIVSELFGKLFNLQGKQHESLLKKVGQGGNLLLTLGDAGKNTYTSFMIGESMTRDIVKGPYIGQFTVTEIPPDPALVALSNSTNIGEFQEVKVNCDANPAAKFIDLVIECAVNGLLSVKNYSSSWYEIVESEGVLSLTPPGQETLLGSFTGTPGKINDYNLRKPFFKAKPGGDFTGYSATVQARKYAGIPTRKVVINCDSNPIGVWGTGLFPRCTSEGTYVKVSFQGQHGVQITLDNGKILEYEAGFLGLPSSGWITSDRRSVEFTITPK
ncbi:hypothetical protein QUA54_13220 [Microcoleus sp. MOSTC5]|uniref:hypothetical protein n=1 Tax=Microcoleus sp. MOSTC5 TaxID=3055378 RepID=UPI002FD445DE